MTYESRKWLFHEYWQEGWLVRPRDGAFLLWLSLRSSCRREKVIIINQWTVEWGFGLQVSRLDAGVRRRRWRHAGWKMAGRRCRCCCWVEWEAKSIADRRHHCRRHVCGPRRVCVWSCECLARPVTPRPLINQSRRTAAPRISNTGLFPG